MYSRILVCVSNPRHAEEMTRLALSVAEKSATVLFLRVVPRMHGLSMRHFERDLSFVEGFKVRTPVKFERRVAEGRDAGRVILDIAGKESADLVVMGSVQHKGVLARISGDISSFVMNNAKCAVVVVKSRNS